MSDVTIVQAFAEAAGRLTGVNDVAGSLFALLTDCSALMHVDAAGVLVRMDEEGFQLLSSTSHLTTDLELYELQNGVGPCLQATETNELVTATSPALDDQWSPVGRAFSEAGYHAVHAFPLRWHRQPVGALNLFGRSADPLDDDRRQLGQAFANLAVAVLVQSTETTWERVADALVGVLADRVTLERAKGVLAVTHDIDLDAAFTMMVRTAEQNGQSVTSYARQVIDDIGRSRLS
jgi:transcriptional regulator with GAF, ATPase, and Fis domain